MAGSQIGGMAWDAYWDKELVQSWISSGDWDEDNGKLNNLKDKNKRKLTIDFNDLVGTFNETYLHDYAGMFIRDSIFYYSEKNLLQADTSVMSFRTALNNLYPDADLDEALRQPGKRGEGLIEAAIKLAGDRQNVERNIALAIYRRYKQAYDQAATQAIQFLKTQAEAEYQARNFVGDAKTVREALEKLSKELKVPLVSRVVETFKSFSTYLTEIPMAALTVDSLVLKRQKFFEEYLQEYSRMRDKLRQISETIKKIGLNPPADCT